jgi:integrase
MLLPAEIAMLARPTKRPDQVDSEKPVGQARLAERRLLLRVDSQTKRSFTATIPVRRVKSGKPSTHPVRGDEVRTLRKLEREAAKSPVITERGGPFTTDSFNWMVKRAGQKADFKFQVHAHMLRHAAGYKLAGDGHDTRSIQDYLGHKNIQHTVRYTELSPTKFKDFWRELMSGGRHGRC